MDPIKQGYLRRQARLRAALDSWKIPTQNIRASELGECKRATYYRLAGFIPAISEAGLTAARLADYGPYGDAFHDQTRRFLQDECGVKVEGIKFGKEQTETQSYVLEQEHNEEKFRISMRLDGVIKINGRKHVLEIKSLATKKFAPMQRIWQETGSDAALLGYIMEKHRNFLYQTHACMQGAKTPRAYLLPVGRNDCVHGLHSYQDPEAILGGITIQFSPQVWSTVLDRCATIARALRTDTPPLPEHVFTSVECQRCAYLHLCHGADQRRKAKVHPATMHPQLGSRLHVDDKKPGKSGRKVR